MNLISPRLKNEFEIGWIQFEIGWIQFQIGKIITLVWFSQKWVFPSFFEPISLIRPRSMAVGTGGGGPGGARPLHFSEM